MTLDRTPCAQCGHPRFVHLTGRGCFVMRRALGTLIRVPAGCRCPGWRDPMTLEQRRAAA
jgi:hypothetical protein